MRIGVNSIKRYRNQGFTILRRGSGFTILRRGSGFTIVELLVVIVVIGILAAITIVSYTGMSQKATVASLTTDLDNASRQLKLDQVQSSTGSYPAKLVDANGGKGIPSSPNTTYEYATNTTTTPQTFCLTAAKSSISYKITNDSTPAPGNCLDYGLALHLDAGNSTSYSGTGTTWADLSGNHNDGTLNGAVFNPTDPKSMVFDGSDYVNAGSGASLQLAKTGSVCMWFKSAAAFSGNTGTQKHMMSGGPREFYFSGASSYLLYYLSDDATMVLSNSSSWDTNWHNVCVTSDGTTLRMYVDGVAQTSTRDMGANNFFGNTGALTINRSSSTFAGQIGDVSVYNRGLSVGEIGQTFSALRGRYGL